MYFEKRLKNLTIVAVLLLHCLDCGGQVELKEKSKKQSDTTSLGTIDSNIIVGSPQQKDSTIYNQYLGDKKSGLWKEFYANGQLKSEGNYSNGKKEGVHREWNKNGQLELEGNFKNGLEQGLMKWFYKGYIAGEGLMKNGKRDGVWKVYTLESGILSMESNFKDGKPDGQILRVYHKNGQVSKENYWLNDEVMSTTCWDENGIKIECNGK